MYVFLDNRCVQLANRVELKLIKGLLNTAYGHPFEVHIIPGHQFRGPDMKLEERGTKSVPWIRNVKTTVMCIQCRIKTLQAQCLWRPFTF